MGFDYSAFLGPVAKWHSASFRRWSSRFESGRDHQNYAGVVELADTTGSKSVAPWVGREGSTPSSRTSYRGPDGYN